MNILRFRKGTEVGSDAAGNRYFSSRPLQAASAGDGPGEEHDNAPVGGKRERRWVVYAAPRSRFSGKFLWGLMGGLRRGEVPALPPQWRAWLHGTRAEAPSGAEATEPVRQPSPYLPPGHALRGGARPPATGDYTPWHPPEGSPEKVS